MEDDQQGILIPFEILILGFAAHFTSGNDIETVDDESLYNLHAALELEIEKKEEELH